MLQKVRPGYVYAIAAAVLFGASTPAAKWLLSEASPWLLAGLLYLGSGLGLLSVRSLNRLRGARSQETKLHGRDWAWLGGATVFGGVLAPVLLMTGLSHSDSASASLLLNLEGVFTAALAWFVFHENFDRRIFFGMIAILTGGIVLSWTGNPSLQGVAGPLCVAAACLCWGIDNNLTKKVSASDALQIAMTKGLVAGTTNTVLALTLTQFEVVPSTLVFAAIVGFLGYGVSLLCFVLALRYIGAARTGAYFSVAPFVGAVIALAVGDESLSWRLVSAGAFMAVGVWLHLSEHHEHEHTHEATEHEHSHVHDIHHQHDHGPNDPPGESHSHKHRHALLVHTHPHFPDADHTHAHPS